MEIAVLIPCYNEELTICRVVKSFNEVLPMARVYVYDNNSTDKTKIVATECGAIVKSETQQGKGNVVRRMFRDIEADYYVLVDGDDTYDASVAADMVEIAREEQCDFVNAVRINDQEDAYRAGHKIGNRLLTGSVRFLFGSRVEDMLSGYKVLSKRFVKSFPLLSSGFEIETELAVHALILGVPIAHVYGDYRGRPDGSSSKLRTYRDGVRILTLIINLFKQERPLAFFGILGSILLIVACGMVFPVVITYLQTGLVPRLPTAILSMGIMLSAFLSFTCGIILDTVTRGRREARMLQYLSIKGYSD
ncbi:Glycosyl transferase family 2 [Acididesulfobacillus acetoxydans]|uniref:Glycosyl transferase 2 n=1 Tax=Acididesulfobacillus acetoxydans TaxID=1561005 RepID=A0A8S0WKS4_9FIRM|nr:glycosyltransferase family 2 protein [Acididesulfobacillus acetoxydans]CAA7599564.1 Glycosyl transferase family 2 [Acididesulfobacillus acetoxydans]CEJ07759.1 Glycosyl transferase 2 [Acididesulfobacillus acetoxydans]